MFHCLYFGGDTNDQLVYVDWKCQKFEMVNPKLSQPQWLAEEERNDAQ